MLLIISCSNNQPTMEISLYCNKTEDYHFEWKATNINITCKEIQETNRIKVRCE